MSKLVICRGLPGSGKSHWAKEQVKKDYENVIRCNRDDIRTMLHEGYFEGPITESNVVMIRDSIIRTGLKNGKIVISDDTNLKASVVKELAKIARFFESDIEIVDFDIDKEECIRRDSLRQGRANVGEKVINDMFNRYFVNGKFPARPDVNINAFKHTLYVADTSKPKAFIFDIDGTCSYSTGRNMYDYTQVHTDAPHKDVIALAEHLLLTGFEIIFLSGREDNCFEATSEWLNKHLNLFSQSNTTIVGHPQGIPLFMRKSGDFRQDAIIKHEIFHRDIAPNYNVLGVFDDRQQVVDMYRTIGVRCYQVNYGNF